VAGRRAAGEGWRKFCGAEVGPVWLEVAPAKTVGEARVIHIDHFGNATTNVPGELVEDRSTVVRVGRNRIAMKRVYTDVEVGAAVALVGSSGLVEIAVRNGSAAKQLHLSVGDRITFV
jgi:S-adenosylmethionine hydrolase